MKRTDICYPKILDDQKVQDVLVGRTQEQLRPYRTFVYYPLLIHHFIVVHLDGYLISRKPKQNVNQLC